MHATDRPSSSPDRKKENEKIAQERLEQDTGAAIAEGEQARPSRTDATPGRPPGTGEVEKRRDQQEKL